MKKTKILLVDDHSLMRIGLTTLLSVQKDITVVGEAEDGETALRLVRETQPDVVIMDLMMPGMGGAEATHRILNEHPQTRVIILTSYGTSADLTRTVAYGAAGVITKGSSTDELLATIRKVAAGEKSIPSEITRALGEYPRALALTPRQQQILLAVSRGYTSSDIADQCGISVSCVKWHIRTLCEILGASNRSEAAAIAMRKHLLKV